MVNINNLLIFNAIESFRPFFFQRTDVSVWRCIHGDHLVQPSPRDSVLFENAVSISCYALATLEINLLWWYSYQN